MKKGIVAALLATGAIGLGTLLLPKEEAPQESNLEQIVEIPEIQGPQIGPQLPPAGIEVANLVSVVQSYYSGLDSNENQDENQRKLWQGISDIYNIEPINGVFDLKKIQKEVTSKLKDQGYFLAIEPQMKEHQKIYSFVLGKIKPDMPDKITMKDSGVIQTTDVVMLEKWELAPYRMEKGQDELFFIGNLMLLNGESVNRRTKVSFQDYQKIRQGSKIRTLDDIQAYALSRDLERDYASEKEFKDDYFIKTALSLVNLRFTNNQLLYSLDGINLTKSQEEASRMLGVSLMQSKGILNTDLPFTHYLSLITSDEAIKFQEETSKRQSFAEIIKNLTYLSKDKLREIATKTLNNFGPNPLEGYRREVLKH